MGRRGPEEFASLAQPLSDLLTLLRLSSALSFTPAILSPWFSEPGAWHLGPDPSGGVDFP